MENARNSSDTGPVARGWRRLACVLGPGCAFWAGLAWANPPAEPAGGTPGVVEGVQQQVRQLALDGLRQLSNGEISRVEVQVGRLDPRLRLAPCAQIQPYIPTGSQLWGRTRIGLRCVQGEKPWNVFLPITIKVMAPALVAANHLPAGHVLGEADLAQAEVDLAETPSTAVSEAGVAHGRTLSRAIGPGQSLRQSHLKPRQWFAMGDLVKVVALGPGYRVVSQGEAVTAGLEGQAARVRLDSGRTLTGMPVADRQMELPL